MELEIIIMVSAFHIKLFRCLLFEFKNVNSVLLNSKKDRFFKAHKKIYWPYSYALLVIIIFLDF